MAELRILTLTGHGSTGGILLKGGSVNLFGKQFNITSKSWALHTPAPSVLILAMYLEKLLSGYQEACINVSMEAVFAIAKYMETSQMSTGKRMTI